MARRRRMTIDGSVALVTGAGSGIGRATALALASRGCTVLCADIDLPAAEKVAGQCEEAGAAVATALHVDVADRRSVESLAEEVSSRHGPLGILVNNAGVGLTGDFTEMSAADWEWIRNVNLDGVVHGCAAFAPAMLDAGRGHVVNISSGLGYTPTATEAAYVTTKAAVLALSQCLRADFHRHGVGVSAVCPGVINTPIVDRTRYVGRQDDPEVRARTQRIFARGHSAGKVAGAVLSAVERDRAIVTVGLEAKLGWLLHRWAPVAVQQIVARGPGR